MKLLKILLAICIFTNVNAQVLVDKVVAKDGSEKILLPEIEDE